MKAAREKHVPFAMAFNVGPNIFPTCPPTQLHVISTYFMDQFLTVKTNLMQT